MIRPVRVAHVTTIDATLWFLLRAQLDRLRHEGFEVTAISAPGPWVARLEAEGIPHIAWNNATRAWDPRSDLRALMELRRIFEREDFTVVHTHNPKPGILGRLAARMARVPCTVNTVHGLYATPDDAFMKRVAVLGLEGLAARLSDLELYQSEEDLAWARRVGVVPSVKSALLGNGTDLAEYGPASVPAERLAALREELGIPEGAAVVGTVGRLVAEKGYHDLLEAARLVRARLPSVHFLAVGPADPAKPDAIREREIAAAPEGFHFLGWRVDVRDLLAVMDVFVLASWREGVPRSAIEAAAMARPLVLTDIRGCREVVRDGMEGILVPPRTPRRLAAAITTLLRQPELRAQMGTAARARALERFDERRVEDILVEQYGRLLRTKGLIEEPGTRGVDETVRIRRARRAEAPMLARFHMMVYRTALPNAFLPNLGEGFMRLLYRAFTTDPNAVTLVAERDGRIIGFATGMSSVPAFYRRFVRRYGVRACMSIAPRLLRPGVLRRILETARYPERTVRGLPQAEYTTLAVAPGVRSRGLGVRLSKGIVSGLAELGAQAVRGTVAADHEPMKRMMVRAGFRPQGEISLHDGKHSIVYVIRCSSP